MSVQSWELQERRRRLLAIIVMCAVVAVCFMAVLYELG